MSYVIAQRTNVKPSDGRWLLLAVLLHSLVIIIPLRDLPPDSITQSAELVVRLVMGHPTTPPAVAPENVFPETEPVREVLQPRPGVAEIVELNAPEVEPEQQPDSTSDVNTARLIGLRETLTDKVPLQSDAGTANARLGELRPYTRPENWQQHAGAEAFAPFDNTFNGMVVPSETVVVDEWKAQDGSQGIILETPSGLRLCGRRGPWDPMRPMIEPLMQMQVCGGDGAIPFKFNPRKRLGRDFIDPVAKDAIQLPVSPD